MTSRTCPRCGASTNDPTARFCDIDGEPLVERVAAAAAPSAHSAHSAPSPRASSSTPRFAVVAAVAGGLALSAAALPSLIDGKRATTTAATTSSEPNGGTSENEPAPVARATTADDLLRRCFGASVPSLPRYTAKDEPDVFGVFKETVKVGSSVALDVAGEPVTAADEVKAGREGARQVEKQFHVGGTATQRARVARVATTMLRTAPRANQLEYRFSVVESNDLNAFMLPGGPGYVLRGLLDAIAGDPGLAFVLGHEISHAALGHASAHLRVSKAAATVAGGDRDVGAAADALGQIALDTLETAYDQDQEYEADRLGFCLAVLAGYPSSSAVEGLGALRAHGNSEDDPKEADDKIVYDVISTHPPLSERIAFAKQMQSAVVVGGGQR